MAEISIDLSFHPKKLQKEGYPKKVEENYEK